MRSAPFEENFSRQQVSQLLRDIQLDMAALHDAAVPLVSGLLIAQDALPAEFRRWLLAQLARRADLSRTTPAAEAALRIGLVSPHRHHAELRQELHAQFALLKALGMQAELESAAQFVVRLAWHLEKNLGAVCPTET